MPKLLSNEAYEKLLDRIERLTQYNEQLDMKVTRYETEIRILEKKVQETQEKLEDEMEKYKKYMKQQRRQANEAAKKWLNGYPDE